MKTCVRTEAGSQVAVGFSEKDVIESAFTNSISNRILRRMCGGVYKNTSKIPLGRVMLREMVNNMRTSSVLDPIDQRIISELQKDGRMSNAELAETVGIAPSTCLGRVRNLVTRGVISGFTALVEPESLGLSLEVLISVTVRAGARQRISALSDELKELPEVLQLFFLGGVEDFIIHMAARDSDHVRDFVLEHLSAHPAVSSTRTSLVFSHHRNPVRGTLPPTARK